MSSLRTLRGGPRLENVQACIVGGTGGCFEEDMRPLDLLILSSYTNNF